MSGVTGKISGDATVPFKPGIFVPGIDMSLPVGSQNIKLLASSFQGISVKTFGAAGDGVTDDTAAFQAAADAAGVGGTWTVPTGTYRLTATINCHSGQQVLGAGQNNSVLVRNTDYGDTFLFASAQGVAVRRFWFIHSVEYGLTDTSLADRVTSNSAHIRLRNAQSVIIEDCWLWRMPFQIAIDQGSLVKIHRCDMKGVWDPNYTAAQEGVAGVQVGGVAYTQIVTIEQCNFGGYGNGPRNMTWSSGDSGAHTFSIIQNAGNQFGVVIGQCEDFLFANNYVGGNSLFNVLANPIVGSVNLDWRFTGNFFDAAGMQQAMLGFMTRSDGTYVTGVTITGNVFNGELQTLHAIAALNPVGHNPTLTNFAITGNTFMATVGSAMMIQHARGGTITGNTIGSYNARNVSAGADLGYVCAAFLDVDTNYILATGNVAGGTVNDMGSPSYCYRDFYLSRAPGTNAAFNNVVIGGGLSGTQNGLAREYVVVLTAAGNYFMTGNEDVIVVNKAVSETTQIILPTSGVVVPGFVVTIKDGRGNAGVNPTQVSGTVDGVANPVFNTAFFTRRLLWNGAQWNVIGN